MIILRDKPTWVTCSIVTIGVILRFKSGFSLYLNGFVCPTSSVLMLKFAKIYEITFKYEVSTRSIFIKHENITRQI